MPLTPLDIEKKEFRRAFRGYSEREVEEFLDQVLKDYEAIYRENMELKEKSQHLQEQMEQYRRLEETLKETMVLAQQTADEAKRHAQKESELIVQEAREKYREMIQAAEEEVQEIVKRLQQTRQEVKVFHGKMETLLHAQQDLLGQLGEELD